MQLSNAYPSNSATSTEQPHLPPEINGTYLTKEEVLAIPNLFIWNSQHRKYLEGKTSYFRPTSQGTWGFSCILLAVGPFAFIGFLGLWKSILDQRPDELIAGVVVLLLCFPVIPIALWLMARGSLLGRKGRLLRGIVISSHWEERPSGDSNINYVLHLKVKFVTPYGQQITDKKEHNFGYRIGMKCQPAPAPGTPVAVLYVNDQKFGVC